MRKTQKDFVIENLLKNGAISRNFCLRNYITRLGAIIKELEYEGWSFLKYYGKTKGFKKENWKNYYYEVVGKPNKYR